MSIWSKQMNDDFVGAVGLNPLFKIKKEKSFHGHRQVGDIALSHKR